jgi:hypothetical protein
MTRSTQTRSVRELLVALIGPTVWFAHFSANYAVQGFLCGGEETAARADLVWWVLVILGVIGVGSLSGILVWTHRQASSDHSDANTIDDWAFLHYLQFAIAGLSLVAVGWTTLALIVVETCAPVFAN